MDNLIQTAKELQLGRRFIFHDSIYKTNTRGNSSHRHCIIRWPTSANHNSKSESRRQVTKNKSKSEKTMQDGKQDNSFQNHNDISQKSHQNVVNWSGREFAC